MAATRHGSHLGLVRRQPVGRHVVPQQYSMMHVLLCTRRLRSRLSRRGHFAATKDHALHWLSGAGQWRRSRSFGLTSSTHPGGSRSPPSTRLDLLETTWMGEWMGEASDPSAMGAAAPPGAPQMAGGASAAGRQVGVAAWAGAMMLGALTQQCRGLPRGAQ
jgi:hypothetical protein